jgi:hypothetical protein
VSDAPIVPTSVLSTFGLYADPSEPHAQAGNHVRVATHPLLGLPVAPVMFWRGQIQPDEVGRFARTDITAVAADGTVLTVPFDVSPGMPVTVTFPLAPGETCIWAQLGVDTTQLNVEVYTEAAQGPALVGVRSQFPYGISAPSIAQLVIRSRRGTHRVSSVEWLELSTFPKIRIEPWTFTNLPHAGSPRYLQVDDWKDEVRDRVTLQAPRRKPLQEETGRPAPSGATPVGPPFELDRVDSLTRELREDDLPSLLTDLSTAQRDQFVQEDIADATGRLADKDEEPAATASVNRVGRVLQSTLDPGAASELGFKAFDPWNDDPRLMVYRVEVIVEDFDPHLVLDPFNPVPIASVLEEATFASRLASIGNDRFAGFADDVESRVSGFLSAVGVSLAAGQALLPARRYLKLAGWCVIDERAPLDPPPTPTIPAAEHVRWLPEPPPNAIRETRLELDGILRGGSLAIDRLDTGSGSRRINARNKEGFHLPILLGLDARDGAPATDVGPSHGFVTDLPVPAPLADYGVAQQDPFGRWSPWAKADVPTAPRPQPPTPVFQARYELPDLRVEPLGAGRILVRVEVPATATLAPASHPVAALHLDVTDLSTGSSTPVTTVQQLPPGSVPSGGETREVQLAAPQLARTESRTLRISARWADTTGTLGQPGQEQLLEIVDPRPPLPLALPETLQFTGRPDVTGLAWAEYSWTPQAGQAKAALYYADETRVRAMLSRAGNTAFLAALDAAADDPARAAVYRDRAGELTGAYFERVQGAIVARDDGTLAFRHAVSGSLAGLGLCRIGVESAIGASTPLEELPILVYKVPNTPPPMPPLLSVRQDPSATGLAAQVTIEWEPGPTPVHAYRLRRSKAISNDPLRMPVVTTTEVTPAESEAATVVRTDDGPVEIAPTAQLRPWTLYSWIAEVQGAPAPGATATIAGRWSRPSAPVGLVLTPPDPPPPVSAATARGTAHADGIGGVELEVAHPDDLDGGSLGSYRVVVIRIRPGGMPERLGEHPVRGTGPHTLAGTRDADDRVTADTRYRLTVVDPLDRESVPFTVTEVLA